MREESSFTVLVALGLLYAFLGRVDAQVTFDGCETKAGVPVASVVNLAVADVATASRAPNGAPVIYYNPQALAWVHPQTRLFFYAHECGHHALGHIGSGPPTRAKEQEADCYGIRTLRDRGLVSNADIATIQSDIARFGRADWSHIAGPYRAMNLGACLSDSEDESTAGHQERDSGSDNTGKTNSCKREYDSCVQDVERVRDCVSARVDSCMDDCETNYGYSSAACRNRLCNPQAGSNSVWMQRCQAAYSRERQQCDRDRSECLQD